MDFLNQTSEQLKDLFGSMTPGSRITAALLLIVVVISLGYLLTAQVSGPDLDLMNGEPVTVGQLQAMKGAFAKAGLNSYEVRGTQIFIPRGRRDAYMAALLDGNALPPNIATLFGDPEKGSSAFESREQRNERVQVAKQKRLSLVISKMNGIENAVVFFGTETLPGFTRQKITTASATVWPHAAGQLDSDQVSSIRHFLSGAIPGLKSQNVTVIDGNSNRTCHVIDAENPDGNGTFLADLQKTYEEHWRGKILNALSYVPGVVVTPTVVLDAERKRLSRETTINPKAVTVRQKDESSSTSSTGSSPAGPPGMRANAAPNAPQALSGVPGNSSNAESEETRSEIESIASGTETESETTGHLPKRISVSVSVPNSYFEKVWRKLNPAEEGQEPPAPDQAVLDKIRTEESGRIQKQVANLLPPVANVTDPLELVNVSAYPDLPIAQQPLPGVSENALAWLGQHWGTVGMIGLALFSLVTVRSMIRSAPVASETAEGPRILSAEGDEDDDEAAAIAASQLSRFSGSGPSLRDELSNLVQEDPDTAANILRSWIGNPN